MHTPSLSGIGLSGDRGSPAVSRFVQQSLKKPMTTKAPGEVKDTCRQLTNRIIYRRGCSESSHTIFWDVTPNAKTLCLRIRFVVFH